METQIANLITQLQDLHPQLHSTDDLASAHSKATDDLEEVTAALGEAKAELETTRDNAIKNKNKNEKDFAELVFTKNQEAEALAQRCTTLQDEHNRIQADIASAVAFQEQLKNSIASLM